MSKPGLFLLSLCSGLIVGLLLGYVLFHGSSSRMQSTRLGRSDSTTHEYFYRLNDSLAARHSIVGSDSGLVHRVDTVPIVPQ